MPFIVSANTVTVKVSNQVELDNLNAQLIDIIRQGKQNIIIRIATGNYQYSRPIIDLSVHDSNLSILVSGKHVNLIPRFSEAKTLNVSSAYQRGTELVEIWSEVIQAPELIKVVDEAKKLCKIKVKNNLKSCVGDYIQISQWYKTVVYKITSVESDYIYFIADDLARINGGAEWNVNYDCFYAKVFPRYRIFSVSSNSNYRESSVTTAISISGARMRDFSISGVNFLGSAGSIYSKGLINFENVEARSIIIRDSKFTGCKSTCVKLLKTDNLYVNNCKFNGNYGTCIDVSPGCNNAKIYNNIFNDNGKGWNNYHVVLAAGSNFMISNNRFCDFCYSAIGVGIWYKQHKTTQVSGIITNNEIYYSEEYKNSSPKHTLMDSGAIYLWTQLDDVIIKENYIHDITGVCDNRGIFCDDGAKNVKLLDNLILRINNSYCIDLREVPYVKEYVSDCNTGNQCVGNVVDGKIRFFIKEDSCIFYNNIKLGQEGYKKMNAYKRWENKI